MRIPALLMLVLAAGGCAAPINWDDPQAITPLIRVDNDPFKKITTYTGPNCAPDRLADIVALRGWRTDAGETAYQIYVKDEYTYEIGRDGSGWRFYTEAYDSDGQHLELARITQHINSCERYVCVYTESIGIAVARAYLESKKDSGLTFKISGRNGHEIFRIPPAYIQVFLDKVPT